MAGAVSELRARFTAQMGNFKSAVSGVKNEISGIGDSTKKSTSEANKAFDGMKNNLSGLKKALHNAGAGSSDMFDGLESAINRAESDLGNFGKLSVSTMLELEKAVRKAEGTLDNLGEGVDLGGLDAEIRNMDKAIQTFGKSAVGSTTQANKALGNYKKTLTVIAGVAGTAFAGIGAGVVGAITITEDYQRALNDVEAQTGATKEETAQMGEAMKNIYANNYGADFADIGESMALVENNTGLAGKQLETMTQNALMLRDTMEYDVAESTKVADTMMKQFGISGDEAFTLIAQGHQEGLDKSGDMLDSFNEYSVYFKQLGFDAEGMWNTFQAGSKAGAFNMDKVGMAVQELGIRVKDGSKASSDAFAGIGLDADKMAGMFAKGGDSAQKALEMTFNALGKVEDPVQRNIHGVGLFGTAFEDLEHKTIIALGNVDDKANSTGNTLKKMNEVKYNTVGEAIQGIGRSLQVGVIEPIQTKVMPTINKMINEVKQNLPAIKDAFSTAFNAIAGTVSKFAPTFESLFTIFKNVGGWLASTMVVAFTALGSVMAPIVNGITSIVAKFTEWEGFVPILNGIIAGFLAYKTYVLALQIPMLLQIARTKALMIATRLLNVTMAMNPIGLIIALLVGLGIALYTAYQKSETFRNIVNGVWNAIKAGAMAVFNWLVTNIPIWINGLISAWNGFKTMMSNLWAGIVSGAKSIWGGLVSFFTGIINGIKTAWNGVKSFFVALWTGIKSAVMPVITGFVNGIKQGFSNFVSNMKHILEPLKAFFKNTWNNIKLVVLGIIGVFLNLITGNMKGLKTSLIGIFEGIKRQIVNIITTFKEIAVRLFKVMSTGIKTIFNGIKSFASTIWNGIKSAVTKAVTSLKSSAINTINSLKSGAVNAFNSLKSGAINSVNALKNGALNAVRALKSGFTTAVNGIKSAVVNGFNTAKSTAINAVNGMKSSISNGISRIKGLFTSMKSSITSTIKGINLASMGRNIVQGLINGITGMVGKVAGAVKKLASTVTNGIKGALKIHSPSRLMRDMGGYVGEGLAIGIDKSKKLVSKATQVLSESAMIETDPTDIATLTGDTIGGQIPKNDDGGGSDGGGVTTNYQAPLMHVENYYDNGETDKREIANGLYNLQVDHDRARGKRT